MITLHQTPSDVTHFATIFMLCVWSSLVPTLEMQLLRVKDATSLKCEMECQYWHSKLQLDRIGFFALGTPPIIWHYCYVNT